MPNKPLLRFALIFGIIVVVTAIIGAFTFLNKWWWAQKINAKYQLADPLTRDGNFIKSASLRSLMDLYYRGTLVDGTVAIVQQT